MQLIKENSLQKKFLFEENNEMDFEKFAINSEEKFAKEKKLQHEIY